MAFIEQLLIPPYLTITGRCWLGAHRTQIHNELIHPGGVNKLKKITFFVDTAAIMTSMR
jgi:hypothetical protein